MLCGDTVWYGVLSCVVGYHVVLCNMVLCCDGVWYDVYEFSYNVASCWLMYVVLCFVVLCQSTICCGVMYHDVVWGFV